MRKTVVIIAILVIVAGLMLAGCGAQQANPDKKTSDSSDDPTEDKEETAAWKRIRNEIK